MIIMKTSAGEAKDGLISEFGFFLSFIANKSQVEETVNVTVVVREQHT